MDAPETAAATGAALARRARAGDRSAFRELYDRYAPMVHAVLLARAPASDADDLVQEVFLTAWRRLAELREPSRVGAWLATIAKNRARRAHARAPRPAEDLADAPSAEAPRPLDDSAEASRAALACLGALPETYRELLAMRLVEGMSGPAIAASLGRSPETVRVQLVRGTKLLREGLARRGWS